MTKASTKFGGLTRTQMRTIFHSTATKRQLAIKYGVTERTILAVKRDVRRSIRNHDWLAA